MLTQNRLRFHYEHVIRPDLLIKSHYVNIMEVPRLCQLTLVSQASEESVKDVMLSLEMICGQKWIATELSTLSKHVRLQTKARHILSRSTHLDFVLRCCLRNNKMYHFLEKLITVLCFEDYTVQFQGSTIQLQLNVPFLRLFPEMQSNIELSVVPIHIIVSTSAKTERETYLLWTGLFQNEV